MMQSPGDCRQRVHAWDNIKCAIFDVFKEHLVVIEISDSHAESFKLLDLMSDLDLRMHSSIDHLLSKFDIKNSHTEKQNVLQQ